jgi:uroporphyrinogen III methyltransferase/synthase
MPNKPLAGRRILITRPREQAGEFGEILEDLGAHVLIAPTIRIAAPEDWGPLDAAIGALGDYDWVIFTSVNGVRFFSDRLGELGRSADALAPDARILAIGTATGQAVEEILGRVADGVPERYVAEGILEMMNGEKLGGKRILIPRAEVAREILPDTLRERGAEVDVPPAYRTLPAGEADAEIARTEIAAGRVDMVTFTSSSTARNFAGIFEQKSPGEAMGRVAVASIGPIASETAREVGLAPDVEAEVSTIPGLARAIVDFYGRGPST